MAHLQCARVVSATKFRVFDYLVSPQFLEEQLAGVIHVKWQNPGIELNPGSEFLFLMTRFGIEQPIRFVVDRLVVGNSITYHQVSGLYAKFCHTIKFEDHGQNETLVSDVVEYELPFGIFGRMADDFFVKTDLKKILNSRIDKAIMKFEELDSEASKKDTNVAI